MWNVSGQDVKMCEGDWGIELPFKVLDTTLTANDSLKLTIKAVINGSVVLEKNYSNISNNTINVSLTEHESELFKVGTYIYALDWYQNGSFYCNLIPAAKWIVGEKV